MKPVTPLLSVDTIIEHDERIVLIERKNPPLGWALPGGFVDIGESVEKAAAREAKEETSLDVVLEYLLYVYSDPRRDARGHTVSVVFTARAQNPQNLQAQDDARKAAFFSRSQLPNNITFDHKKIIDDYYYFKEKKERPSPHNS